MALSESDVKNLVELFKDVGFEGIGGARPDQVPDFTKNNSTTTGEAPSEPAQEEHVDDDIMALLDDKPDDTEDHNLESPAHDDEDFGFLDEPEKKTSRLASKIKKRKEEDITPVTSHTYPEALNIHLTLTEDRVNELFTTVGELNAVSETEVEGSYLDEGGKSESRLMSRVKKPAKEEVEVFENFTFPKSLNIHQTLDIERISAIFKGVGESENSSSPEVKTSYLDDESKNNSRLLSRVKQHKKEEVAPVENNIMPKALGFNMTQPNEKVIELFRAVGE
ncbi:MAG: hypothetical protein OEZ36_12670 [Spirochaetota bacterium]|nr:hypothetical protein [Spirochaetota bacterium]